MNTAFVGGATDKSVHLTGWTASTGVPYTAGAYNTSGITAKYRRHGANAEVTITLATQTANGAHSDGGFVHVSGGRYRLDLPDAAIASGSDYVDVWVYGITDTFFETVHIDITGADPRAATVDANVTQISGDSAAADNLEAYCDGTTPQPVNVTQLSGDATAADNAEAFFDGTGYAGTNNVIPTVTTATNVTTVNGLAAGVITATSIAANAITDAKIATGAITNAKFAAGAIDATAIAAAALPSSKFVNADPVPANVQEINDVTIVGDGSGTPFNV